MNELGLALKEARESSGVSIQEAGNDLNISELSLKNIEEGNIGCFKDIYELKTNIKNYAKYLGLDENATIDEFNEYLFEYTSKIPLDEIEKKLQDEQKQRKQTVISPYTNPTTKVKKTYYIFIYLLIIVLIVLSVLWALRQIAM